MTRMLASVADVDEAQCLLAVGVDILDIKEPRRGALGAVDTRVVGAIVALVDGRVPVSATIGDLPMDAEVIHNAIMAMRATGVDIIKVGVFAPAITIPVLDLLRQQAAAGARIVLVYFADRQPACEDPASLAGAGIQGVMLDTADKRSGSLRAVVRDETLRDFVRRAQVYGLMTGLAGSLQVRDIEPLLKIRPDYLGFRGALCRNGWRQHAIDPQAARAVRTLIPRADISPALAGGKRLKAQPIMPPLSPSAGKNDPVTGSLP